jgi:uncharacterized protein YegP (UPF0339 family)
MKFLLYRDKNLEWRWRLMASNGRVLADSGEGYKRKGGARKAAEIVRAGVAGVEIVEED